MKRHCYYVDETMKSPDGYIPAVVTEDEPGYTPCIGSGEFSQPWYWGDDIATARQIAAEANAELGLTEKDVDDIMASSIGASIRADATRAQVQERRERAYDGKPLDPPPVWPTR